MRDLDRRAFLTTTGASVASIAVAGCLGGNGGNGGDGDEGNGGNGSNESTDNESNETGNERTPRPEDVDGEVGETSEYLEITSFSAYEMVDNAGVMGVVENVGDAPLDDIEIEVTLNDGDTVLGEFIDTSTEDIDYLRPGNRWRFDVVFEDEDLTDATDYTISADAEVVEENDVG